jgi:putative methyltransferase (TIGR04325 family)
MAKLKDLARPIVMGLTPPALMQPARRFWRLVKGLGWDNFYGAWPRLADVPVTKETDDTDPWSQTIAARWRENLVADATPICDDTGQLILPLLASRFSGPLTVLDFGGGPGVGLANIRQFARLDLSRLLYVLVETPAMCGTVRNEIEAHGGKVVEKIRDALPRPLIVNASSSLQYISDYRAVLCNLARLTPEIFIVSQTPVSDCLTYARQILNTPHKKMATWVFNRMEFAADMRSLGYRPIFSVDHDLPLTHGRAPGPSVMASMVFVPARPRPIQVTRRPRSTPSEFIR